MQFTYILYIFFTVTFILTLKKFREKVVENCRKREKKEGERERDKKRNNCVVEGLK